MAGWSRFHLVPVGAALWRVSLITVMAVATAGPRAAAADASAAEIASLIAALGDTDYAVRETAAASLAALGPGSVDALLTAAETSADLEVALRARWLADSIPPTSPRDPPAVTAALQRYDRADFPQRLQIMRRLLRLDDDAGIEALARLVRQERSPDAARAAAALLVLEWRPGDPAWERIRPLIAAGVRESGRPAARFLRALVAGSVAAGAAPAADEAAAALALLEQAGSRRADDAPRADDTLAADAGATTLWIFRRGLVDLLVAADRRPEAVEQMRRMFDAGRDEAGADEDGADFMVANLIWAVEHGLPEAVDLLAARWPGLAIDQPVTAYAAAVALAARGDRDRAERMAEQAFLAGNAADGGFTGRLRSGLLLAKWGAAEWAMREYRALLDDPQTPAGEFALAGILCSEFLHDLGHDDEAADVLRRVVGGRAADAAEAEDTLRRLDRDPDAIRSRAAFFASCAAASRGDPAGRRRLVEDALRHHGRDVDALIALYEISAADPQERAAAQARVERALDRIEDEIQALPDDANGYNEYAWLVANTTGDVRKAVRYSKKSLEISFDNPSYLDTLAHCQFAAGDHAAAVRTQAVAQRLEPHNRTIRRNLERFRSHASAPARP
ncbi:MAG: hypothetical protein LW698_01100 [Planctomycetaceae bacterium]|nr:hypothetical protein [Planctomycetaceae bacterium]